MNLKVIPSYSRTEWERIVENGAESMRNLMKEYPAAAAHCQNLDSLRALTSHHVGIPDALVDEIFQQYDRLRRHGMKLLP